MRALVTGITGQDGSYLAELLIRKGYEVFGLLSQRATPNTCNIDHLPGLRLIKGDLTDQGSIDSIVKQSEPDEVYNLAAQSFVKSSWDLPEYTGNVNALGTLRVLDSIRKYAPHARFYQASTSEMFGKVQQVPQSEETKFYPRSPYGVAKLYAHWMTINYRESYGMHASCGILFNHESPRRGEHFVTRKIALAAARISKGEQKELVLGNLDPKRDIGHAKDYVQAMWLMLQQEEPDDYVIATGDTHTIQEMVEECFQYVNLDWKKYVKQSPEFMRPAEVSLLVGDPTKAKTKLGWEPSYSWKDILHEMIDVEIGERPLRR
jgi:GDPmannose 4,6-dehydratase